MEPATIQMEPASNRAPKWTLVLFFAPLVFAVVVRLLEMLLQRVPRWQQLSRDDNKRRSAMMALVKGVAYSIGLGLGIPVFMQVVATWGAPPTWNYDDFPSTAFSAATAMSAMLYAFELTYKPVVTYNVWLHHAAAVVVMAIASTGVFLAGSELQRGLMASWTTCIALPTSCRALFYFVLLAYHLQLDNFTAKKRLAVAFNVLNFCTDRGTVLIPLAYTASSWGMLTTTSKVLMLTLLCCFVPEHIVAARTIWGIYRLNRDRISPQVAAPVPSKDADVAAAVGRRVIVVRAGTAECRRSVASTKPTQ